MGKKENVLTMAYFTPIILILSVLSIVIFLIDPIQFTLGFLVILSLVMGMKGIDRL